MSERIQQAASLARERGAVWVTYMARVASTRKRGRERETERERRERERESVGEGREGGGDAGS